MKQIQKSALVIISLLLLVSCGADNPLSSTSEGFSSLPNHEESEISSSEISENTSSEVSENSSSDSSSNLDENEYVIKDGVMYKKTNVPFKNPVYEYEFPDPHIIYDDQTNTYWAFGTLGKILKSIDAVTWNYYSNVFKQTPSWGTSGAAVWAPDIQYIAGQYVYYYSLSTWGDPNPGIGIATAPHPSGPWTDRGELFRSIPIGVNNSIDANVFVDPKTSRVYCVWGSMRGNYMVELSADGLALKDGSQVVAGKNKTRVAGFDTDIGWTVGTYEGAYIIYRNNYYYLFLSTGTCCEGLTSSYKVVVARSRAVKGPYFDAQGNSMLDENVGTLVLDRNNRFVGPGHNSILHDINGDDWIYYHSYIVDNVGKQRVMLMDKILWDEDDWPYVKNYEPSISYQLGPTFLQIVK